MPDETLAGLIERMRLDAIISDSAIESCSLESCAEDIQVIYGRLDALRKEWREMDLRYRKKFEIYGEHADKLDAILGQLVDRHRHTTERLDSFVDAIRGKRLTFSRLTA